MDKFEYARYTKQVLKENAATRERSAHKRREKLVEEGSTTHFRGRKNYGAKILTSAKDKLALSMSHPTPITGIRTLDGGHVPYYRDVEPSTKPISMDYITY